MRRSRQTRGVEYRQSYIHLTKRVDHEKRDLSPEDACSRRRQPEPIAVRPVLLFGLRASDIATGGMT